MTENRTIPSHDIAARRAQSALPAIYLASAAVGVALGGISPLIALVLEARGEGAHVAGLNAATVSLAVITTARFVPALARRFGTAETAFFGTLLAAVSLALFPVFNSIPAWFVLRALLGIGLAFGWVITETWINLVAAGHARTRLIAIYTSMVAVGYAAGPLVIEMVGTRGPAPFLIMAAAFAVAGLALVTVRGRAPRLEQPPAGSAMRTFFRAPTVVAAAILAGLLDNSVFTLLPVWAVRSGLPQAQAVADVSVFVIGGIVMQLPLGWLADRVGQRAVIIASAVLCVAAPLGLMVSGAGWVAWTLIFLWGTSAWAVYTVALAMLGARFSGGAVALANAAFVTVFESVNVVGPPLGGISLELWMPHGVMVWFVGTAALTLGFLLWRARPSREA